MILNNVNEAIEKSMKQAADNPLLVKHRNFLRLIKGELQTVEVRQNKPLTEEQCAGVLKKILKSNEETINTLKDDPRVAPLLEENELIRGFLPYEANDEEILAALSGVIEQIKAAVKDGAAIGVAMKTLKEAKMTCDGNAVKEIVAKLRQQ